MRMGSAVAGPAFCLLLSLSAAGQPSGGAKDVAASGCMGCHQEIPDRSLAVSLLHHVAEYTGQIPKRPGEHDDLVHKILLIAGWFQVAGMVGGPLVLLAGTAWLVRRWRRKRAGPHVPDDSSPPEASSLAGTG